VDRRDADVTSDSDSAAAPTVASAARTAAADTASEIRPFGDSAWLLPTDDNEGAHRLAAAISRSRSTTEAPPGWLEVVIGSSSVVVEERGKEAGAEPGRPEAWLAAVVRELGQGDRTDENENDRAQSPEVQPTTQARPGSGGGAHRPTVEVPVVFDGPDLDGVAAELRMTPSEVADLLIGTELRVAFLGFSPGFGYLVGLPAQLASLARHPTPRTSVPAGSVAAAGGFAAIYPQSTPGGWRLLGHTDLSLFDPQNPPYALLRAGDGVRFRRSLGVHDTADTRDRSDRGQARGLLVAHGPRSVEVIEPGLFTLVQDAGRRSGGDIGVPQAGPADPVSMALANRLVGNHDDDAALELTARGPSLRFGADAHIAVVGIGAEVVGVTVNGRSLADGTVIPVTTGQVVELGAIRRGLRAYLAVSGAFDSPTVVGSRSSDVLSGLGPGALVSGDCLDLGIPGRPHGLLVHTDRRSNTDRVWKLRVLIGPHRLEPAWTQALLGNHWEVDGSSNRIGIRLRSDGAAAELPSAGIASTGMITGAIQVPPDGHPIILMPDHATVGGYPVIATVIAADRAGLGQVRPGDTVRFEQVDLETARHAARTLKRQLAGAVSGWFPTESGT
jgi:biotin-dependent carboxylase-like uncharacterized protein